MNTLDASLHLFDTHDGAEAAIRALGQSGFDMKQLSLVGKGYHSEEKPMGFYTVGDRIKAWGGTGAFWGGIWGLLLVHGAADEQARANEVLARVLTPAAV